VAEIGPYRVLRLIRRGGAGTVYAAHDQRLNRRVALKLIPVPADKEQREAIIAEARALARLNHRSIVQIFDVVETLGHVVLVMEYVSGTDLQHLCEQTELGVNSVVQLAMDVCAALGAAHQARIAHRDLKPGNILIDPNGRIKLTDFGIAQSLSPPCDGGATLPGTVPGSYLAMSPEHAAGLKLDERADMYALGLLIYRCLAGRHPFADAENELVLLQQLQHRQHPPLGSHGRGVPEDLSLLVDQLLDKDPRQRPGTPLQVRQALLEILRGLPVSGTTDLSELVSGRAREEDKVQTGVDLPAGVGRGARSRLLSQREWGPWTAGLQGLGRRTAMGLAFLVPVLAVAYLAQDWWSRHGVKVKLVPPVVLAAGKTGTQPGPQELASLLHQVVGGMPGLVAVDEDDVDRVSTRVRCNTYLCELQLVRERQGQSVIEYATLMPDAPLRVWRDKLVEGMGRLYP
jgi:predicted Ser/Thr protein kinase